MAPKPPSPRLLDRALGAAVAHYIGLVERTSAAPPLMDRYLETLLANHPMIIAMWHGQFMLLPTMSRFGIPTKAMLALHRDAEGLGFALDRYGIELIRGAGASAKGKDRGGSNAFRGAVHALESGFSVAMTADVPPGPARRAGHGIVTLAKVSGRPIVPVAMCSSHYWALPTWSRMTVNLPGSQLGASFGAPVHVPQDASPEQLEAARRAVETQLNIATVDAYQRAGVSHVGATPPAALTAAGEKVLPGKKLKAYVAGTRMLAPAVPLALSLRQRRGKEDGKRLQERYGIATISRPDGVLAWVHAASVGETMSVLPLLDALKRARPDVNLLLTTGTVTAAQLAAARLGEVAIHQFVPWDTPQFVGAFLDHWQPSLGVFVESEIWPNLILQAAHRDIPMALVNARMSKTSFRRWRAHSSVARPLFSRFAAVLAQSREFADRFTVLGAPGVVEGGNLKLDAPPLPVDAAVLAAARASFGSRPVFVAASTHPDEEVIVAEAHALLRRSHPALATIIVPRHPHRGPAIAEALAARGYDVLLRSQSREFPTNTTDAKSGLLIADTLGELGSWFSLASVVFMGKSLSKEGGGHNPIEAARFDVPIVTGPNWANFEAVFGALRSAGGIAVVRNATEMAEHVERLLGDPAAAETMRKAATKAVGKLTGALPATVAALLDLLPAPAVAEAPPRLRAGSR